MALECYFSLGGKSRKLLMMGRNVSSLQFSYLMKPMIIVEHSFFRFCRYYEMTQHSHEISRSFVLCLRFISRTISANTSLTFVRCLALASTNEQPHIWAKACKKFNNVSVSLLIRLISCFQNTTHHALNSWNFTLML